MLPRMSPKHRQRDFAGGRGDSGLEQSMPFQLEDWKLTGIRWDQIFALSSERNDARISLQPRPLVSLPPA